MKRTLRLLLLIVLSVFSFSTPSLGQGAGGTVIRTAEKGFEIVLDAATNKYMLKLPALRMPELVFKGLDSSIYSMLQNNIFQYTLKPMDLTLTRQFRNGLEQFHVSTAEVGNFMEWAQHFPVRETFPYYIRFQSVLDNPNNLYLPFAENFYMKTFNQMTPRIKDFLKTTAKPWDRNFELDVLQRIELLGKERKPVADFYNMGASSGRLKYLDDALSVTPQTWNPQRLILSFERKYSSNFDNTLFPHLNPSAKIWINGKQTNVRGFNQVEHMDQFYTFLLNGYSRESKPMTISFRPGQKQMMIYNADRSSFVRIAEHEYSGEPHAHLGKITTVRVTVDGVTRTEDVLHEISIPIKWPSYLPQGEEDMYELMITKPMRELQKNPNVTVE